MNKYGTMTQWIAIYKYSHNIKMSFVCCNHQTSVIELVRNIYVCLMISQILHNIQTTIEACSSEWGGISFRWMIHICTCFHKSFNNTQISCSYNNYNVYNRYRIIIIYNCLLYCIFCDYLLQPKVH